MHKSNVTPIPIRAMELIEIVRQTKATPEELRDMADWIEDADKDPAQKRMEDMELELVEITHHLHEVACSEIDDIEWFERMFNLLEETRARLDRLNTAWDNAE